MDEIGKQFYFNFCLWLIFVAMNAFCLGGEEKGKLLVLAARLGTALLTSNSIVKIWKAPICGKCSVVDSLVKGRAWNSRHFKSWRVCLPHDLNKLEPLVVSRLRCIELSCKWRRRGVQLWTFGRSEPECYNHCLDFVAFFFFFAILWKGPFLH